MPCECNEYVGELLRGVRQHLATFIKVWRAGGRAGGQTLGERRRWPAKTRRLCVLLVVVVMMACVACGVLCGDRGGSAGVKRGARCVWHQTCR